MLEGVIYRDMFSTAEMRSIWSEDNTLNLWLEVERAVCAVQADLGLIPAATVDSLADVTAETLDRDRLTADMALAGRPIVGLVKQLRELAEPAAARSIHKGITTQDLMDSALVLQMKASLDLIDTEIGIALDAIARLDRSFGDAEMIGRTNGQHALPMTFGQKLAAWSADLNRRRAALTGAADRNLSLQLGGPVGNLSAFDPPTAEKLRLGVAHRLGLKAPETHWQNARDGIAEIVQSVGLLGASVCRIAHNVNALAGTDIGELREAACDGQGASSSMAHKQNQRASEFAEALGRLTRQRAEQIGEATLHEHERSGGVWIAEWVIVPDTFLKSSGALMWANRMLNSLVVQRDAMAANLAG